MLTELLKKGYRERNVVLTKRIIPVHAMVTSCGHQKETEHSYDYHGMKRGKTEWVLFQYTLSGRGILAYEQKTFEMTQGHAMIVHFPHDNRYWLPRDSNHWEFMYLCLYGSELVRIWREIENRLGPCVAIDRTSPVVTSAATVIFQVLHGEISSALAASKLAYSFTMDAATLMENAGTQGQSKPAFIRNAISFAEQNIHDQIGVDEMAKAAGYSRFHFTRLFTQWEGIPPGNYLIHLRLNRAVELLQNSSHSVKEIASMCGFYDATHFCKLFRNATGVSPESFRKSGMYSAVSDRK